MKLMIADRGDKFDTKTDKKVKNEEKKHRTASCLLTISTEKIRIHERKRGQKSITVTLNTDFSYLNCSKFNYHFQ